MCLYPASPQVHCYTGLTALLDHSRDLSADTGVSMLCCFDHEEVKCAVVNGGKSKCAMCSWQGRHIMFTVRCVACSVVYYSAVQSHRQVGSDSAVGAGSPIMSEAISRVIGCFDPSDEMLKVLPPSFSCSLCYSSHP